VRLQKLLAAAGLASRRGAEELLRAGRVTLNGRVAGLGESADPARDRVALDGRAVMGAAPEYWIAHKPAGVLTSRADPQGRPTVMALLPSELRQSLFPVGRLDRETEGLLLLTNDGDLAHALLHPSFESEREYAVSVRGCFGVEAAARLASGIVLDGTRTAAARVSARRFDARSDATHFRLTLREGRKRQIRRAAAALGHPVLRLVRVRMGPLRLGTLAPGAARRLAPVEIQGLREHAERARRARAGREKAGSPEAARVARRQSRPATARGGVRSAARFRAKSWDSSESD
jgi:pseudouridine synthase